MFFCRRRFCAAAPIFSQPPVFFDIFSRSSRFFAFIVFFMLFQRTAAPAASSFLLFSHLFSDSVFFHLSFKMTLFFASAFLPFRSFSALRFSLSLSYFHCRFITPCRYAFSFRLISRRRLFNAAYTAIAASAAISRPGRVSRATPAAASTLCLERRLCFATPPPVRTCCRYACDVAASVFLLSFLLSFSSFRKSQPSKVSLHLFIDEKMKSNTVGTIATVVNIIP